MNKIPYWLNPAFWFRSFGYFVNVWFRTTPFRKLDRAAPALIALLLITLLFGITYKSNEHWRLGLVRDQIKAAKAKGSNKETVVLAKRLLSLSPNDADLRFDMAVATMGADAAAQARAKRELRQLATKDRYGKAVIWLLENEFSPITWDEWGPTKQAEFGNLLAIAALDQPNNLAITSLRADYFLTVGNQQKAVEQIAKLLEYEPTRAIQGASILRELGREAQATTMAIEGAETLQELALEQPENVDITLARAQLALFLKKYSNAIDMLSKTAKFSKDERLRAAIGEAFVLWSRDYSYKTNPIERFAIQLSLLNKAVAVAPNHPMVIAELMAITLRCADVNDPKVAELRQILVQGVSPEIAHFIQGTSAMMKGETEEAILHLELAAKSMPNAAAVLNNLAVTIAASPDGDVKRALDLVNAAIKQNPNQPYFYETRGQIYLQLDRAKEAIPDLEAALSSPALRVPSHRGLSVAYAKLGQTTLSQEHTAFAEHYAEEEAKNQKTKKGAGIPVDDSAAPAPK